MLSSSLSPAGKRHQNVALEPTSSPVTNEKARGSWENQKADPSSTFKPPLPCHSDTICRRGPGVHSCGMCLTRVSSLNAIPVLTDWGAQLTGTSGWKGLSPSPALQQKPECSTIPQESRAEQVSNLTTESTVV